MEIECWPLAFTWDLMSKCAPPHMDTQQQQQEQQQQQQQDEGSLLRKDLLWLYK